MKIILQYVLQRSAMLQEMSVLPANTYLLKEAYCSPSHQPNNTSPSLLASNLPIAASQQTLTARFSILNLGNKQQCFKRLQSSFDQQTESQRNDGLSLSTAVKPQHRSSLWQQYLQAQPRVLLGTSSTHVGAPPDTAACKPTVSSSCKRG